MKKINDGLTRMQRFNLKNPGRKAQLARESADRNPEARRESARKFHEKNPEAHKGYNKKWSDANKDKIHAAFIKRRYGLTKERFEEMIVWQNAKCAICQTDFSEFSKRPFVDHDHNTGKVRALLCGPCNVKVGYVETEGAWRNSVLAYIAQYKESE